MYAQIEKCTGFLFSIPSELIIPKNKDTLSSVTLGFNKQEC